MKTNKTVLLSAYAVNPYHGSEDGMGWNFICQIARFNKVIAVTRANTRADIERYQRENPTACNGNIQFLYYDLPYWMRFWKKGSRGAMLYYYLWQFFLPVFVRRQKLDFDIVHNLNFHNDWTPSRLWVLRKPFVWGPIGHHPRIPKEYVIHVYGYKTYLLEQLKWGIKKYFWNIDPFLRQTVAHADAVLAMNSSVSQELNLTPHKVVYMPSVSSELPSLQELHQLREDQFTVMSAGRFVPLKGFDITLKSFARFYASLSPVQQAKARLVLVGDGPYREYLERMVGELKLEGVVSIHRWMERSAFRKLYAQSSVFLFPSHEGAGMVVSEALSFGLPVLCFKNHGPGEFINEQCGITVNYGRYNTSITQFAQALKTLHDDPAKRNKLSEGAMEVFKTRFNWDIKGEHLKDVYESIALKAV